MQELFEVAILQRAALDTEAIFSLLSTRMVESSVSDSLPILSSAIASLAPAQRLEVAERFVTDVIVAALWRSSGDQENYERRLAGLQMAWRSNAADTMEVLIARQVSANPPLNRWLRSDTDPPDRRESVSTPHCGVQQPARLGWMGVFRCHRLEGVLRRTLGSPLTSQWPASGFARSQPSEPGRCLQVVTQRTEKKRLRKRREKRSETPHSSRLCGLPCTAQWLEPGGLRGRVFRGCAGETDGGTPGPGGPLDRRVPHGRARWTCLTLSVSQPEAARAGQWWVGG